MRIVYAALISVVIVIPTMAADTRPKLPTTATKLKGAEITALYDGSTMNWHNFVMNGTGTAKYDLQKGSQSVNYDFGGKKGSFTGKIRVKGDMFCFIPPKAKEACEFVYVDGTDVYEVNGKKQVDSKLHK